MILGRVALDLGGLRPSRLPLGFVVLQQVETVGAVHVERHLAFLRLLQPDGLSGFGLSFLQRLKVAVLLHPVGFEAVAQPDPFLIVMGPPLDLFGDLAAQAPAPGVELGQAAVLVVVNAADSLPMTVKRGRLVVAQGPARLAVPVANMTGLGAVGGLLLCLLLTMTRLHLLTRGLLLRRGDLGGGPLRFRRLAIFGLAVESPFAIVLLLLQAPGIGALLSVGGPFQGTAAVLLPPFLGGPEDGHALQLGLVGRCFGEGFLVAGLRRC